jgi:DNA-binding transcriptional ArsR family regulator
MPTEPEHRIPVDQAAQLFGLLGDATRLRVLLALAEGNGDVPVAGLARAFGLSQTALSHHLQRLRLAGAVTCRRKGNNVFYALAPGPVRNLLRHVRP